MADIVLIHGFASGIRFSIFRPPRGMDAYFTAFHQDVVDGTAKVFYWDIPAEATFFQSLNPFYLWNAYAKERERALSSEWQQKLFSFLEKEQPRTLVCHSLGCRFLLETMNRFGLPASVKNIVFNQSDIPSDLDLTNPTIRQRITEKSLVCFNVFCPWDTLLWTSSMLQCSIRDGLFPSKKAWMIHKHVPLKKFPGLHLSTIHSSKFREWVKHLPS
jgi:hypothetical protein